MTTSIYFACHAYAGCYGRLGLVMCWCSLCAADRFRVLLKGEHPDYIHAVFAHVSSKGAYELVGDGRSGGRGKETRREGMGYQEGGEGRPGRAGGGGEEVALVGESYQDGLK